ncbi:putative quinol monooxygenase [Lichenifustis flavocetrariae]|uniref:Antibiotic biosynthesis monooxygenase n=1 Tax=Lichenifustis flavocetrariae TaxID=2949735 RepID=A0AA41YRQ5_9HYPH|nr:antibiotic biosynthesis monooxygenase [Lichenifustis flavocetrariae]MCW6506954.1 antibiotic biosynthesis monooxygenase [Lichenifustis flavocetrariae]
MLKLVLVGLAATIVPVCLTLPAQADDSKTGIYEVSEIYVLPSAMSSKKYNVPGLIEGLVKATKADEGLLSIKVTQQIGQRNNYTVIEQWKDQSSLDKHVAADHRSNSTPRWKT